MNNEPLARDRLYVQWIGAVGSESGVKRGGEAWWQAIYAGRCTFVYFRHVSHAASSVWCRHGLLRCCERTPASMLVVISQHLERRTSGFSWCVLGCESHHAAAKDRSRECLPDIFPRCFSLWNGVPQAVWSPVIAHSECPGARRPPFCSTSSMSMGLHRMMPLAFRRAASQVLTMRMAMIRTASTSQQRPTTCTQRPLSPSGRTSGQASEI